MAPPAPVRLSTTIVAFIDSPSFWATNRATVSVPAPGGNGTTRRMGLLGQAAVSAPAPSGTRAVAVAARRARMRFMIGIGRLARMDPAVCVDRRGCVVTGRRTGRASDRSHPGAPGSGTASMSLPGTTSTLSMSRVTPSLAAPSTISRFAWS